MKISAGVKRFALVLTLLVAVFSSGAVIAHECHALQGSKSDAQTHFDHNMASGSNASELPTSVTLGLPQNLVEGGCAVILMVILLMGRKYLLSIFRRTSLLHRHTLTFKPLFSNHNQVFQISYTLPQLGVFRI